MNWARTNKLLAGFLVFVAIGVVALGYLLFSAYGAFSKTSAAYEEKARELNRLRSLRPFPNAENLKAETEQKDAFAARIGELQEKLNSLELPVVPLTPEEFQDKLRKAVSDISKRAADLGTEMSEGFYLGFENYRDALPGGAAAGPLGRQLEAIENVVSFLLDNRVDKIGEIGREPLPEEVAGKPKNGAGGQTPLPLVTRYPFRISFVSSRSAFRRIINTEASAQQQFFITRLLEVRNEELKGPERGLAASPAESAATAPPGGGAASAGGADGKAEGKRIELLLGDEKVEAAFEIEIVDFAAPEPEKPAAK